MAGSVPLVAVCLPGGHHFGGGGSVADWDGVERDGVGGNGKGGSVGVDAESIEGQVGHVIANTVVVDIVSDTSLTAKELGILLALDFFGTGEETTTGDADVEEGTVVRATAEFSGGAGQTITLIVLLEEGFDLGGSGGSSEVEGRAVTVVDHVGVVGGGDHIEVEVHADLGQFLVAEAGDVELTSQETVFLGGPEGESNGVVDVEVGERLGDNKVADDTRSIIVDTGA